MQTIIRYRVLFTVGLLGILFIFVLYGAIYLGKNNDEIKLKKKKTLDILSYQQSIKKTDQIKKEINKKIKR